MNEYTVYLTANNDQKYRLVSARDRLEVMQYSDDMIDDKSDRVNKFHHEIQFGQLDETEELEQVREGVRKFVNQCLSEKDSVTSCKIKCHKHNKDSVAVSEEDCQL